MPADKVAGNHKENIDAEVAAAEIRHTNVVTDDSQYRDSTEALNVGPKRWLGGAVRHPVDVRAQR